jgi:hypothetical protein
MVVDVREGASQRSVARRYGVSLPTVQRWLARAGEQDLDAVDWSDRSSAPHRQGRRISGGLEDRIIDTRRYLRDESVLGEHGAVAIRHELVGQAGPDQAVPSVRTIGRVLERRGVLDAKRRVRRPAPPRGWYLPALAERTTELDSFDTIEGLRLKGGVEIEILTGVSLHGGLAAAWPGPPYTARRVVPALVEHWQAHGTPGYAQFDNALIFHGTHAYPDRIGRVSRLCLGLGVVPVFVPPREHGFQAAIESLNGRWQAKLWARGYDETLVALVARSAAWVAASRARSASRIEAAPERRALPTAWRFEPAMPLEGRIIYIRRTDEQGRASLLGHRFPVDARWPHRLVRAEVDLEPGLIRFYALRRREPDDQPLLREVAHRIPRHDLEG